MVTETTESEDHAVTTEPTLETISNGLETVSNELNELEVDPNLGETNVVDHTEDLFGGKTEEEMNRLLENGWAEYAKLRENN